MTGSSEDLAVFVRDALAAGEPRPRIEAVLLEAGWPPEKVSRALRSFAEVDFPLPVPRPRPYLSAREAFLYLTLFTALFLFAFNLGTVLFELIERAVPDPVGAQFTPHELRWGLAFVLVNFPLFLFLTVRQARELARDPEKRGSRVRKWLTYLTLFVAGGFLVGDLVALIAFFLEGELTARFLLKAVVVGVLATTAFVYYMRDLRQEER